MPFVSPLSTLCPAKNDCLAVTHSLCRRPLPANYMHLRHVGFTCLGKSPRCVVKALGRAILTDKEIKSIVLVHSPRHRDENKHYPLWLATVLVNNGEVEQSLLCLHLRHRRGHKGPGNWLGPQCGRVCEDKADWAEEQICSRSRPKCERRGKSNAKASRGRKKLNFSPVSGLFCDFFCKFVVGLSDL